MLRWIGDPPGHRCLKSCLLHRKQFPCNGCGGNLGEEDGGGRASSPRWMVVRERVAARIGFSEMPGYFFLYLQLDLHSGTGWKYPLPLAGPNCRDFCLRTHPAVAVLLLLDCSETQLISWPVQFSFLGIWRFDWNRQLGWSRVISL